MSILILRFRTYHVFNRRYVVARDEISVERYHHDAIILRLEMKKIELKRFKFFCFFFLFLFYRTICLFCFRFRLWFWLGLWFVNIHSLAFTIGVTTFGLFLLCCCTILARFLLLLRFVIIFRCTFLLFTPTSNLQVTTSIRYRSCSIGV